VPNFVVGIPVNRFQERGVEFEEVYAVSGPASNVDPSTFTTVNPGVSNQFPSFSPTKTFAMFNDNTIDFSFVLPSNHANPPAGAISRGFGAIFIDVETPNTTSIEYFSGTSSLGKFFVPVGTSGQAEFFGVLFQNPVITNVHIELGTATLFSFDGVNVTSGPADNPGGGNDLAVTDDFVYAEPTAVSTGININAMVDASFTAKVASFTDADPNGQVSDFTAIIDWGDATTSAGTITPNASGGFDVSGSHAYNAAGLFTIITSIRDIDGSSISAKSMAIVGGPAPPNPIDITTFFVNQHYRDFLNRDPDPPGFNGWVNTINNCAPGDTSCDRVHVSEAFFRSPEFQQRGYFVYRFYPVSFGRKPNFAEFTPDLTSVGGFLTDAQLEAAKVAFANSFVMRPAFANMYNSPNTPQGNTAYVDALLTTAGVTLSSRQSMIDGLNNGTLTRAQVLRQIVESNEVSTKYFNQAFVVMEYFGYLRRDPDALYLDWITFLNSGASSRTMVSGFVNSLEYRQRFGPP